MKGQHFIIIATLFGLGCSFYWDPQSNLDRRTYNPEKRPINMIRGVNEPVTVYIQVKIDSIDEETTKQSKYIGYHILDLDVRVSRSWIDKRLSWNRSYVSEFEPVRSNFPWMPDLSFLAEKKRIDDNGFIRIYRNGEVIVKGKSLIIQIPLIEIHLGRATLQLKLLSLRDGIQDVVLAWNKDEPIQLGRSLNFGTLYNTLAPDDIDLGECHTMGLGLITLSGEYNSKENYSCLYANIDVKKKASTYFIMIYLPSCLCIFLSWVPFWMDVSNTLGRSLLPLASFVYLLNQKIYFVIENLLYEGKIKLNAWIYGCIVFVLSALFQVVMVNFLNHGRTEGDQKYHVLQETAGDVDLVEDTGGEETLQGGQNTVSFLKQCLSRLSQHPANCINVISRCLFPIGFLIFCLIMAVEN